MDFSRALRGYSHTLQITALGERAADFASLVDGKTYDVEFKATQAGVDYLELVRARATKRRST